MRGDELVRALYERNQERDWNAATVLVHPEARLRMPAAEERLDGRQQVIGLQRDHTELGELRVLRVVADSSTPAAEVEIGADAEVSRCAASWRFRDALLHDGVEYWVTVGGEQPPEHRAAAG